MRSRAVDIFQAARYDLKRVKECLEGGRVLINSTDRDGDTALIMAATVGYLECVRYLLDQGADPNIQNKVRDLFSYKFIVILFFDSGWKHSSHRSSREWSLRLCSCINSSRCCTQSD
jgi:hypothetical protein